MIKRNDSLYAQSPLITVTYFCICFVLVASVRLKPERGDYYMPGTVCASHCTMLFCSIFIAIFPSSVISSVLLVRKLRPKEVK